MIMPNIDLFPHDHVIGVFRGFRDGGLEFHADLVLPYRNEFQSIPMHGQFLLVQLESTNEAVLGRITSFSSEGKLAGTTGEEFNIRAVQEERPVPEDLREQYLRYRVNIRVLGVLRNNGNNLTFVPSHRRLPHVGSKVAFASDKVLCEIAGHNALGAPIGHFALGEYIYAGDSPSLERAAWMQIKFPEVLVKFPISNLVARRSFIFARAGFGKSNLNKLLFSKLYEDTPTVTKRGDREVPVGTIIFDPDGEYFWPDDKGRPGLCDVPALQDKLVVFTPRTAPSNFYQSFVADGIKLDIRQLRPSDVIGIALSPDRQEQQNVRKLKGLDSSRWSKLVDLIARDYNQSSLDEISKILGLEKAQEIEALAARANMSDIVRNLHDKSSQLWDKLILALSRGKLCIIDVSQMRGKQSLILSGLILRKIFDRNQQEFTAAEPQTIPTIAVVEEAQSVLNENAAGAEPYIAWVKEGRKYDLGALLITQQPGSIPVDILSQGDNWFIFHLLSSGDLTTLRRAKAHFIEDLLSSLLNEPIPGQGVFWSSVGGQPYPIAIRALSFEAMYPVRDPNYTMGAVETFALQVKQHFDELVSQVAVNAPANDVDEREVLYDDIDSLDEGFDFIESCKLNAIEQLRNHTQVLDKICSKGMAWRGVMEVLIKALPAELADRNQIAYDLVRPAMDTIFGGKGWRTFKNEKGTTIIIVDQQ